MVNDKMLKIIAFFYNLVKPILIIFNLIFSKTAYYLFLSIVFFLPFNGSK